MEIEFSNYPAARRFFEGLSNQGIEQADEILTESKEIEEEDGPFMGALFLKLIYEDLQKHPIIGEYIENAS